MVVKQRLHSKEIKALHFFSPLLIFSFFLFVLHYT